MKEVPEVLCIKWRALFFLLQLCHGKLLLRFPGFLRRTKSGEHISRDSIGVRRRCGASFEVHRCVSSMESLGHIDADTPTCYPRLLRVLPGRTDVTRLVAEAASTRLLVLRHSACLQLCWPRRKDVYGFLAEALAALAHHRRSLSTTWSSRTSSSVICMCNASVYSETCSMLQSASRLSHL